MCDLYYLHVKAASRPRAVSVHMVPGTCANPGSFVADGPTVLLRVVSGMPRAIALTVHWPSALGDLAAREAARDMSKIMAGSLNEPLLRLNS
jgi:hypothetical protein